MILKAYSRGLYANWYLYAPDRVLFDCGEGAALTLRARIFAIEKIFLSHGHIDHIAGIPLLLSLRQSTKGDNEKPLTIYYPARDRRIVMLRDYVYEMMGDFLKYPLTWEPIKDGDRIEVRKGREVHVFQVRHPADDPLGFAITEPRKRLKAELIGQPGPELAKIPAADKFDYYDGKLLAYSGDSMPMPPELYRHAEILIHDCTFLSAEDREAPTHATIQEVFDLAKAAEVKRLILCHLSPRYESRRVIESLIDKAESYDLNYEWIPNHRPVEFD